MAYTNIATIIEDGYRDPEDTDGVFSGFNADNAAYTVDTWQYKGEVVPSALADHAPPLRDKRRDRRRARDDKAYAARRSHAATPELRLSDHAPPLRPLYA